MKSIPISEMKDTAGFARAVEVADGPITVTKNGYDKLIVMTPNEFSKYSLKTEEQGEEEILKEIGKKRAAQLERIFSSAEAHLSSSGLPAPTDDEISAFIAQVRAERTEKGLIA